MCKIECKFCKHVTEFVDENLLIEESQKWLYSLAFQTGEITCDKCGNIIAHFACF